MTYLFSSNFAESFIIETIYRSISILKLEKNQLSEYKMSIEYYMFLEEVRVISCNVERLQESNNDVVLSSLFFMEDLKKNIDQIDGLLKGQ